MKTFLSIFLILVVLGAYFTQVLMPCFAGTAIHADVHYTIFAYTTGDREPVWHSKVLPGTPTHTFVLTQGFSVLICEDYNEETD